MRELRGLVGSSTRHHLVGNHHLVLVPSVVVQLLVLVLVHHRHLGILGRCPSRSVERSGLQQRFLDSNRKLQGVDGTFPEKVSNGTVSRG